MENWLKLKIFTRDNHTCQKCGYVYNQNDGYIGKYIECDHIIPIALGGAELDPKNLQTLCVKCHKEKTKEDVNKIAEKRREEKERLEAIELEKKKGKIRSILGEFSLDFRLI